MAVSKRRAEAIITIIGEDEFSKLLDDLKADVGKKVGGAVKDVNTHWTQMAVGINAAIQLTAQLLGSVGQMAGVMEEAGQSLAIEDLFQRTNENANELLNTLREASGQQLNDTSLQQFANKAHLAKLSIEETATVLNLATKAANATGKANKEVAESFLDALVRGNDRAFKQVGLNIDIARLYDQQAKALGKSTVELTIAEKRTTLLREATAETAKAFGDVKLDDTTLSDARQFQAEIDNLNDSFTRLSAEGMARAIEGAQFAPQLYEEWFDKLSDVAGEYLALNGIINAQGIALRENAKVQGLWRDALLANEVPILTATGQLQQWTIQQGAAAKGARELATANFELSLSMSELQRTQGINDAKDAAALEQRIARLKDQRDEAAANTKTSKSKNGGGRSKKGAEPFGGFGSAHDAFRERIEAEEKAEEAAAEAQFDKMQRIRERMAAENEEWRKNEERMSKEHAARMDEMAAQSLDRAQTALADASQLLGDGWEGVGGRIAAGLGPAISSIGEMIDQTNAMIKNGESAEDAWTAAAIGMAKITASFVGDASQSQGIYSTVMAAVESAEAWKSFAAGEYASGAMHVVAAGLYTAAAVQAFSAAGSKGKGGGARGGGARRSAAVPSQGASLGGDTGRSGGGKTIIVNYNGTTFASREQFDREVRHANTRVDANQSAPMWSSV